MNIAGSPFGNIKHGHRWGPTLVHAGLIAVSLLFVFPLLWMIATSLKPDDRIFVFPPTWFTWPPMLENYPKAVSHIPFWTYTKKATATP